jgi:hypothetical protein
MFNLTQGETPMKTLTRITGITVLGVAVAAGVAFAQTDGVGPNGPGGRSTDAPNQPVPPTTLPSTPEASDRNALPAITPTQPDGSATQSDGSAVSPSEPATTPRSPRVDRN